MATHRLLTVGKPRDRHMLALVEEYLRRTRGWLNLEWETVTEEPFNRDSEEKAKVREKDRLLRRLSDKDFMVLLDVRGRSLNSEQLSHSLEGWMAEGRTLTFVIGGSLGVHPEVRARAKFLWSLSPLTFPHGLAAVMVAEQLYRGLSMMHHHPYHKA